MSQNLISKQVCLFSSNGLGVITNYSRSPRLPTSGVHIEILELKKLKYNNNYSYVILGAGAPHAGKAPAALHETSSDQSVLEWVSEAYATKISNILFVAGYRAHEIKINIQVLKLLRILSGKILGVFILFCLLNLKRIDHYLLTIVMYCFAKI